MQHYKVGDAGGTLNFKVGETGVMMVHVCCFLTWEMIQFGEHGLQSHLGSKTTIFQWSLVHTYYISPGL